MCVFFPGDCQKSIYYFQDSDEIQVNYPGMFEIMADLQGKFQVFFLKKILSYQSNLSSFGEIN